MDPAIKATPLILLILLAKLRTHVVKIETYTVKGRFKVKENV